jgi:hypothetical protein
LLKSAALQGVASAYVAVARTGNPNHPGLPHCPHTRDGATMVFDNHCEVRQGLEAEGLALVARS